MDKHRLVYVRWTDPSGQGGWHNLDFAQSQGPSLCETVGWAIRDDDDVITVVGSRDLKEPIVGDRTTIPKTNVQEVVELQKRGKR